MEETHSQHGFDELTFESSTIGVKVGTRTCASVQDVKDAIEAAKGCMGAFFFEIPAECEDYGNIKSFAEGNNFFSCEKVSLLLLPLERKLTNLSGEIYYSSQ